MNSVILLLFELPAYDRLQRIPNTFIRYMVTYHPNGGGPMYTRRVLIAHLIEAALDQPSPTPALVSALNYALDEGDHSARLIKWPGE